jgi:hypothetical protein
MPSMFKVRRSPCIQAFRTFGPTMSAARTIIIFVMIFKKVRIFCSEEKKRYGHPLWMDIARPPHEARVTAHAAVHRDQGIDAGVSCCRKQARSSAPAPAQHGDLG